VATEKAYLKLEHPAETKIPCLFNPTEFEISKSNEWKADDSAGKTAPKLKFGGGSAGTMSLKLTFDTTADGTSVTTYTNKLVKLTKVETGLSDYDSTADMGRPPWVQFCWGSFTSFKAVVTSLSLTFTYFSSAGTPLRANAQLSLQQFEPDASWGNQNPTSGTPTPHRTHQVVKGETLDRISARHYGDATQWRQIAEANGITDPLALRPGALLLIPNRRA
jgi:nucleoid-associated protein YgaU